MKKGVRQKWHDFCKTHHPENDAWAYVLCNFCRYGETFNAGDNGCDHPIDAVSDYWRNAEDAMTGGDCWGFQPSKYGREMMRSRNEGPIISAPFSLSSV